MKLHSIAIGVVLGAGAVAAQAAAHSFVMPLAPQTPYGAFATVSSPSFIDTWSFTTPANTGTVSASVISVDITSYWNIDSIDIDLFMGTVGNGTLVASGVPGESSKLENIIALASTDYYYQVTGNVVGASNGSYAFSAVAAPVPEPETYAMMLAGLGAVGFIAFRRRRQD